MAVGLLLLSCSEEAVKLGDNGVDSRREHLIEGLPEPDVWRVQRSVLSPVERERQAEVDEFVREAYGGWRILTTTQTYSGDIIDWLDPSTVPGSDAEPPPPTLEGPDGARVLSHTPLTDLELYPELRGPRGSIPMTRPTFEPYVLGQIAAKNLREFIRANMPAGQPSGQTRLYGGYVLSSESSTRAISAMQNIAPAVSSGTFSLLETAVYCAGANPTTTLEMVGIAVSRGAAGYSTSDTRVNIEFYTAGVSTTGNNVGGWNEVFTGFVPASGRPYGPGVVVTPAVVGGSQWESPVEIQLFAGNWWISHNHNWLGYYPGTLFDLIQTSACLTSWYGEVYDPSPTDWTDTDMGSGQFAAAGYLQASFHREPWYMNTAGVKKWPDTAVLTSPTDANCYTTSTILQNSNPWGRYFFLGGPGGDNTGCN